MPRGGSPLARRPALRWAAGSVFRRRGSSRSRPACSSRPPRARLAPASARRGQNGLRLGGTFDMRARNPSRMPPNTSKSAAIWREERPLAAPHIKRRAQSHRVSGEKGPAPDARRAKRPTARVLWQHSSRASAPACACAGRCLAQKSQHPHLPADGNRKAPPGCREGGRKAASGWWSATVWYRNVRGAGNEPAPRPKGQP